MLYFHSILKLMTNTHSSAHMCTIQNQLWTAIEFVSLMREKTLTKYKHSVWMKSTTSSDLEWVNNKEKHRNRGERRETTKTRALILSSIVYMYTHYKAHGGVYLSYGWIGQQTMTMASDRKWTSLESICMNIYRLFSIQCNIFCSLVSACVCICVDDEQKKRRE